MTVPIEPISSNPTLSGKPGLTIYANPPFHPNILSVGGANRAVNPTLFTDSNSQGASLHRGMLVGGAGVTGTSTGNTQYRVNFLYNPATIGESRAVDINSDMLPAYNRNPDDPGNYVSALNTTITFSLLFDRTFELWDSQYNGTIAGIYGVRSDIEAFYNLLNINQPQVSASGLFSNKKLNVVQGAMTFSPCNLYFSNTARGALAYFGYVTEIDVTYSHFAANMVPARCAVDVTFACLPVLVNTTS